jgi:sugar lactone lactonase YvrE
MIYDDRPCALGEGPLWHPLRKQLFWFDILACKLHSRVRDTALEWQFDTMVSAAGWIDHDHLLVASAVDLRVFNIETGVSVQAAPLEADNSATRPNDGRCDAQGGFWIGTMGKSAETGAGAIYRYYRGALRKLYGGITIPNAICFTADGKTAHFTDTVTARVMRVALDAQGWPNSAPEVFLDLSGLPSGPDGAVVDAAGLLWLAQWGAGQVTAFAPDGAQVRQISFDAPHTTCPAFGGDDLTTLFCTTALQGMSQTARSAHPHAGMTFAKAGIAQGQAEHQVILQPKTKA